MKHYLIMSAAALMLIITGCQRKGATEEMLMHQRDSLNSIIAQRDNDINDMMGTLNEIQDGFRQINEAENRLSIVRATEGANKKQQIRENIKFISEKMQQNRELIKKLQDQVAAGKIRGEEMAKAINNLMKQLEEKDRQMQQLREELDAKNIHISELDETINNLNSDVANKNRDIAEKSSTISNQDKQLNTAWFVFGTKKELKDKRILEGGKVLQGSFDRTYFTKIDIRENREIKLYSRSAKLLTAHPSSSYTLAPDESKQYVLTINNPQLFWSTSKYLVIQVR